MLSEGAVRGFRKWFFKAMCRGEFGANPADELTSVPCQTEVFFMMSERIRRACLAIDKSVFDVAGRR